MEAGGYASASFTTGRKFMTQSSKSFEALNPTRFKSSEYARNTFHASAHTGASKDDILNPPFWAHIASQVSRFDHIEVVEERGVWWADLLITSKIEKPGKPPTITVDILHFKKLEAYRNLDAEPATSPDENYEVKFRGPKKWSVIHKDTREILVEGLETAEEGQKWVTKFGAQEKAA
jgi:hypothetical protein